MSHAVHHHFRGLKRLLAYPVIRHVPCNRLDEGSWPAPFICLPCGGRDEGELFLLAQGLRNEIRQLILCAATEKRRKEELCTLLESLLKRYGILKSQAYRFAINNFISRETEIYCSFRLDTEELTVLWTGSG